MKSKTIDTNKKHASSLLRLFFYTLGLSLFLFMFSFGTAEAQCSPSTSAGFVDLNPTCDAAEMSSPTCVFQTDPLCVFARTAEHRCRCDLTGYCWWSIDTTDCPAPPESQTLRVLKNGTGTGTVSSSPSGIYCGSTCNTVSESTRLWTLTASPSTGSTFTRWSIPQYTYNTSCGGYHWWGGCSWYYTANTCGTLSQCRVSVSSGSSQSVTATFTRPLSLTAGLTVSPTSGNTNTTFNFTTSVGGTATGTVTYGTPSCGTGGTRLNWSGSSDSTFSCRYSSSGTKTATTYIARQGLNASATRSVTVGAISLTAGLTVSPTSGNTNTTFNFTTSVGGTATGTVTYGTPSCGTGGTRLNWSGSSDSTFSCRYSSSGTKTATAPVSRQGLSATGTRSLTVATAPTLTASLGVSPTSGTTNTTYNFTTTVTGGTATGTVTYGTPNCGTGGTLSNWSGSSDSTFSCRYSSSGTKTAIAPVVREGVSAAPTRTLSVGTLTLTGSLAVSPTSGTINTTYNFTTTVTGGTATGAVTYGTPNCGSGGTRTSWNGTNLFSCTYTSSGLKAASAPITRQGVAATPTVGFTIGSVTVNANLAVSPASGGTTATTYDFTASVTGGTATGTTTFGVPNCGSGVSYTNWVGPNDSTFSCRYPTSGLKTAVVSVMRQGVSAAPSRSFTVGDVPPPPPPIDADASLVAIPTSIPLWDSSRLEWSSGGAGVCTGLDFSTGTPRSTGFTNVTPTASREYSVLCQGLNGGASEEATAFVTVTDPGINEVRVRVTPAWIARGGETTVSWEVFPIESRASAECTVSGIGVGDPSTVYYYDSGETSTPVSPIQQAATLTVECENDAPSSAEGSATVYTLPSYSEF